MYTSYHEAAEALVRVIGSHLPGLLPDHVQRVEKLRELLRIDTVSRLHSVDFLQPERVLRCLRSEAPWSIRDSVALLYPRSWRYMQDLFQYVNKNNPV